MISNPIPYIVFYCTDNFLQYLIAMYVLLFENSNQQGISNLCLHVTLWKTYEISFHIVQNTYIFPLYTTLSSHPLSFISTYVYSYYLVHT